MKIAIGTPIHEVKGYGIHRWLDNVKQLQDQVDYIFISDNSNEPEFLATVQEYAVSIGITKAVFHHEPEMHDREDEYRRMISREWFRNQILASDADVWLSWECDIIVGAEAIATLLPYLNVFDSLTMSYPDRDHKDEMVGGIGFAMLKRGILERFSFLDGGGYAICNQDRPNCYYSGDSWLMQRAIGAGFVHADFSNLFPIDHLGN